MVSASVWLTCEAVRHHSKCTPTALTMIDISTRPEMALRIPMRMGLFWLRVCHGIVRVISSYVTPERSIHTVL